MLKQINVSIIIPVFNGEIHINNCVNSIIDQDFKKNYEIIFINDASTDKSLKIIKEYRIPNLKVFSLSSNSGQSAARNLGIKEASGEYVFFMDVDDKIEKNTLSILFNEAIENNYDFVCSDFKRIENLVNQRENTYNYPENKVFNNEEIISAMNNELHDPTLGHLGLFGCNGRLIRRSILIQNNIFFEEKLRWLEDKTFCWDVLSHVKSAKYIKQQLYSYFVYPEVQTAVIDSLLRGFPLDYIKLIVQHIRVALKRMNLSNDQIQNLCHQGLIFFCIQALISISRSIVLGKIDKKKGKLIRNGIIKEILEDKDVVIAIKKYKPSNKESRWVPKAIALNSSLLVELACTKRAKDVVGLRRKGKM